MSFRKIFGAFLSFLLLGLILLLILFPAYCANAFQQGLLLCGQSVLPALFPFFVVSGLLLRCPGTESAAFFLWPITRLCGFRQKQAPLLLLLGWTGGYAVCAACLAGAVRTGQLTPRQAAHFAILAAGSSPGFVIGFVGGLVGENYGLLLYAVQLAACCLCALLWGLFFPDETNHFMVSTETRERERLDFSTALGEAVTSSLTVCGCVLFFGALSGLFSGLFFQSGPAAQLLSAVLEITGGCAALVSRGGAARIYGLCSLLSLYSLSVWLQLRALSDGQFSLVPLLLTRPLHLGLSLFLLRTALTLFPGDMTVCNTLAPRLLVRRRLPADAALLIFVLCCVVLHTLDLSHRAGRKRDEC